MEKHLLSRPQKTVFPQQKIDLLRDLAVSDLLAALIPDEYIEKIILIGSSVKGTFGKYDPPGFRGSLFSDFDFVVFVSEEYHIPDWLELEPDGKPFSDEMLNHAYRLRRFIQEKYDIEVFFIYTSEISESVVLEAEKAGIPMSPDSKHPHIIIYKR